MLNVRTVEKLRLELERIQATPANPNPNEVLRLIDGIILALEQIAEDL